MAREARICNEWHARASCRWSIRFDETRTLAEAGSAAGADRTHHVARVVFLVHPVCPPRAVMIPPRSALSHSIPIGSDGGLASLAAALRDGTRTATDVVEQALERTRTLQGELNALVEDRAAQALEEARLADQRRQGNPPDDLPVLHGVPFVVGENIAVTGMPHTGGRASLDGTRASRDATAVARLRDAGAICIGVANTAEAGFGIETRNGLHGRTGNPRDPARAAGGSAGGVGALVACGAVPFGLALDLHGDARLAGHFCGVHAIKPTGGLVPITGVSPHPRGKARRYATIAPLARRAEDLAPLLRILAGPDGEDRAAIPLRWRDPAAHDFTWKRVVRCPDFGLAGLSPDRTQLRALDRAARVLALRGAEVEEWRPQQLGDADEIWLAMHHEANGLHASFADQLFEGAEPTLLAHFGRAILGRSPHTLDALGLALVERLTRSSYMRIQRLCALGRRLRERLNTVLGDGGVLLTSPWPIAVPAGHRTLRHPRAFIHSAIFNVLEVPAAVVPVTRDALGMPIAVQIVAAQGRDDAALAAAAHIAQAVGSIGDPPR
ncbi:MAG: amidase [Deltaproteobacteria bacterium]|nr:MAG: amidase [Deltaproteobacteria bacterium]